MSEGVGPPSEIGLPNGKEQHSSSDIITPKSYSGRQFLTFRQLNVLSIIIVFAASGLVSFEDFAFVIFSFAYIFVLSKFAFPSSSDTPGPLVFGENNQLLGLYVWVGAFVGLIFPIAYIFEEIYEGKTKGIKAAAPHVFLLASQVFMEGVTFSRSFSLPVRVFVPVFYNARRIFTLVEWLENEFAKVEDSGSVRRLQIGRGLAIANMIFWSFNLFGFLLPVYLPRAFKIYYGDKGSHHFGKDD